jgi:branched-chain amino acid transport system permease protein
MESSIFFKHGTLRSNRLWIELLAVAAAFALLSALMSSYWIVDFMIFCVFVLSFDLLYGYMGHLSFGVMLYYGAGAYATAIWLAYGNNNALMAVGVALLVTAVLAALLGAIAIQTRHASFALINMAFNEIGFFFVRSFLKDFTYGDDGLSCSADPLFGVIDFYNTHHAFFLLLFVLLSVYAGLKLITGSPFGITIRCIHEDEQRVRFLGYNPTFYKWLTFVIASVLAGLAGCLFALIQGFVSPEVMSPFGNVNVIFAVLIGGAGYLYGGLAGALIFMLIKNYLPIWTSEIGKLLPFEIPQWEMWLGIILLVIVFSWRQGVVGVLRERILGRRHRRITVQES